MNSKLILVLIVRPLGGNPAATDTILRLIQHNFDRFKLSADIAGEPEVLALQSTEPMIAGHLVHFDHSRCLHLAWPLAATFDLSDYDSLRQIHEAIQSAVAQAFDRREPPPTVLMCAGLYAVARWGEVAA